jgi:hypothetical protein
MQHLKKLLFLSFLFYSVKSMAQPGLQDSIARERTNLNKTHLFILGAWASANIIQGSISASNLTGKDHYFHQMNVYWNTVNFALSGIGLLMVKKQLTRHFSLADNIREQEKVEKLLLLNTGLDAAYIMTGAYLKERGTQLNNEKTEGYGNSLIFQGAFLLVFDIIQYTAHRRNGKFIEKNLGNWLVGPTSEGLGLSYRFK